MRCMKTQSLKSAPDWWSHSGFENPVHKKCKESMAVPQATWQATSNGQVNLALRLSKRASVWLTQAMCVYWASLPKAWIWSYNCTPTGKANVAERENRPYKHCAPRFRSLDPSTGLYSILIVLITPITLLWLLTMYFTWLNKQCDSCILICCVSLCVLGPLGLPGSGLGGY